MRCEIPHRCVRRKYRIRRHSPFRLRNCWEGRSVRASSLLRQLAKGGCAARRLSWVTPGFSQSRRCKTTASELTPRIGMVPPRPQLEGNTKAKVLQVLATFAYADYCRSAATPGARCRDCHGTGRAVDIAKTELWGRVVEKECGRCKGVGYSRMPASAAYRAVTMLIPNLTQPTWSRTVKPLYDALVVQCHKEESIADNILNAVTR